MALFGKKKGKTVDLTNRMMRQRERMENLRENMRRSTESRAPNAPALNASGNSFGFLDSASQMQQTQSYSGPYSETSEMGEEEKKRKLAKRLMDITDKLEELSNQLYHLQQRVELLEKKAGNMGY